MTRAISMTYTLAMAIGQDAATRRATLAGRAAWNADDAELAAKTANDVMLAAGLLTPQQHAQLSAEVVS